MNENFEREMRGCFDYFWNETNCGKNSAGYGITRDQTGEKTDFGSIAATGFALCAYAVGAEKGYVTREAAAERAVGTLKTFKNNAASYRGFFHHFLSLSTAERWAKCEVSDIDTTLLICGAITAGEYFGGEAKALADGLFDDLDWAAFVNPKNNCYVMGYVDETGFIKADWDHYAEHLAMCVLGAGSKTHAANGETLYAFDRPSAEYGGLTYIRTFHNALFVHQFSHAFIDFRGTVDKLGVDWFENSVNASRGHRRYCLDNADTVKTYAAGGWGLSACHYKGGYSGSFGARPADPKATLRNDGTVAPYAALSSLPFTPKESLKALDDYAAIPELWGKYGLFDSFNLDENPAYFDPLYLGIDKGITIAMMANYESGFVWKNFMRSGYVKDGLKAVGIVKKS